MSSDCSKFIVEPSPGMQEKWLEFLDTTEAEAIMRATHERLWEMFQDWLK